MNRWSGQESSRAHPKILRGKFRQHKSPWCFRSFSHDIETEEQRISHLAEQRSTSVSSDVPQLPDTSGRRESSSGGSQTCGCIWTNQVHEKVTSWERERLLGFYHFLFQDFLTTRLLFSDLVQGCTGLLFTGADTSNNSQTNTGSVSLDSTQWPFTTCLERPKWGHQRIPQRLSIHDCEFMELAVSYTF